MGCANDASNVRPIAGTEQVAIYEFCISVSPDERWLAFSEWVLPKSRVFEDLPAGEYESRIATVDLQSGQVVRHAVDSTLATSLGFAFDDRQRRAGFELIKQRFRPPGWSGQLMFFQPFHPLPDYVVNVALDPQTTGLQVVSGPRPTTTCSDCPPMTSVHFRDRSWDLLSKDVSAVVIEGKARTVYYVSSPFQHRQAHYRVIYRIDAAGPEGIVVEKDEKKGTLMSIASIRVSPDERYMAYVVHSKKQAFLSGPREELFIKELVTGREQKIAKYTYMGNLIWSPDGKRLYFAGGEYSSDSAVRVVDVAATFSK
jgi:hypothetical protein